MGEAVLQGSLASFKLPELLLLLATSKKTGTLAVAAEGRTSHVLFSEGALVFAVSDQEKLRLSAILLRKRKITADQCKRIDALMRKESSHFGEVAVQQGLLTEEQLRAFLKIQVSEVIYDVLLWHGGRFSFSEDVQLPSWAVTISIDLPNLIMEGARRIEQWEQCQRLLPDSSVVFRVVTAPRDDKISLTADEWKMLFLVNGQRTLDDLVKESEEDPLEVYRIVYGLHANKLIEIFKPTPSLNDTAGAGAPRVADDTLRQGDATVREHPEGSFDATVRDDTSLLVDEKARLSYSDVVKPVVAQLTIADGVSGGTVIPLTEDEYTIGRLRENTIHLSDLGVSGHHARIFRSADGYVIEDMKSRNGIWINGTRIYHGTLRHGDRIRLGATDLKYEILFDATAKP